MTKTIVLIGARGFLGSKVLQAVLDKVKQDPGSGSGSGNSSSAFEVKTMIRPGSDASKIEAMGIGVVRGDMMQPDTLQTPQ